MSTHRKPGLPILTALLALLATAALGAGMVRAQTPDEQRYEVRLLSRQFLPAPGLELDAIRALRAGGPDDRVHYLLQVYDLPDAAERQRFEAEGVSLVAYLSGHAYVAASTVAVLDHLAALGSVRWAGPLQPDDKLSADLRAGSIGQWARHAGGEVLLTIQVHQDVAVAEAEALVARLGGTLHGSVASLPAVTAAFHPGQVQRIAREDIVQFVDVVAPPLGPTGTDSSPAAVEPGVQPSVPVAPPLPHPAATCGQP